MLQTDLYYKDRSLFYYMSVPSYFLVYPTMFLTELLYLSLHNNMKRSSTVRVKAGFAPCSNIQYKTYECYWQKVIILCGRMPTSLLSIIAEAQVQEPRRRQEGWSQGDREEIGEC